MHSLEEKEEKEILENYAAARANGTSYSKLMGNLKKANIDINRKMLAEIAVSNPEEFTKLVELANQAA